MHYEYSVFNLDNPLDHLAPNKEESATDRYIRIRPEASAKVRETRREVFQYKTVRGTPENMDSCTIVTFNYRPTEDPLWSFLQQHDMVDDVTKSILVLPKDRKTYKLDGVKVVYTEFSIDNHANTNVTISSKNHEMVDAMRTRLKLTPIHLGLEAYLYGKLR